MKYLITGGGTGGHIYPALSIANEIKLKDREAEILYVGTDKGLEAELVPREGIDFKTIRVKGMPRKINKESFIAGKELLIGLRQSKKIIKEFQPDIVIGTGGYVCGPLVYMAKRMKLPAIIHEQNAFPGITNKILSRYVDRVAVTFPESKKYFKHPDRVVNTGNPIRRDLLQIDKAAAYKNLNIDKNKRLILSFGGSGGQKKLNDGIYELIRLLQGNNNIQLIHVTGRRFYEEFLGKIRENHVKISDNIRIYPYFYQMPEAINLADLVVSSAGAITLAEISAVGAASILLPKSYTAENHQEYNARAFADKNASILVLEKDMDVNNFANLLIETVEDREKLDRMKSESKKLGKIDAAERIYDIIKSLLK